MKTIDDIEALKKSWLEDPCWDLWDAEGFEDHRDELMAYSEEQHAKWYAARMKLIDDRVMNLKQQGHGPDAPLSFERGVAVMLWDIQDRLFQLINDLKSQGVKNI